MMLVRLTALHRTLAVPVQIKSQPQSILLQEKAAAASVNGLGGWGVNGGRGVAEGDVVSASTVLGRCPSTWSIGRGNPLI